MKKWAYTSYVSSVGKIYSGPSKLLDRELFPIPLAYHNDVSGFEGGWQEYHSKYFHVLLQMSGSSHVILPSWLTGMPSLAKAVFKMRWEYGPCFLLFKSGKPSHFVPSSMTNITVSNSSTPQTQSSMLQIPAVASGSRQSSESSSSRFQANSHLALTWVFTGARSSFSQASGGSVVPESPGIPEDFEVQQPKSRSAKKRRISGGQAIDEQTDHAAALAHVKKWVMENIRDMIAFN